MSNMSEIPNDEYDRKRWSIVEIIEQYLEKHPDDAWAKTQISLLMELPIIERGGLMGNSEINDAADLFDLEHA